MAKYEDLPIPVFSSLEPVYGDGSQLEEAQLRFQNLKSKFLEVFGHPPHVFARSPGSLSIFRARSLCLCLVAEKVLGIRGIVIRH
jgi:N-acetylgalactosamine kinase